MRWEASEEECGSKNIVICEVYGVREVCGRNLAESLGEYNYVQISL
jgi:hypothetical protein